MQLLGFWWMQGDEEAKLQLSVTPMCDRSKVIVSSNQLRFINFLLKVSDLIMNIVTL